MHKQSSKHEKNSNILPHEEDNNAMPYTAHDILESDRGREHELEQDVPRVNDADTLQGVLPSTFIAAENTDSKAKSIYISTTNRISAFVLGVCMLVFSVLSMIVDVVEKDYDLKIPIGLVTVISIFSLLWLRDKKRNPAVSQLTLGFTLTALSFILLIGGGPSDGSSMIWVVVMPGTTVLCMGLLYGGISFAGLYIFMLALFFTPLGSLMDVPLTDPMKVRMLLVSLATFCFVWFLEFARFKTNFALHKVAYNIEQTSLTDALTGLGNRRDFDRSFKWTMARSKRSNSTYSLAILDIDHFKRINDTYGHAVGDDVLRHIAKEVETQIRNADRLFRWGGEEFTIIMPSTSMNKAVAGAERVRRHIERTPFLLGNEKIFLTVSLGLYSGMETDDMSYVLNIADQCLYRAKSTGRNKVVGGI